MNEVYLVYADTFEGYGVDLFLIGVFSDPSKAWDAHDKYISAVVETAKNKSREFNGHRNDDGTLNETKLRLYLQNHTFVESCELDHIHSLKYCDENYYANAIIPEGAEENDTFYLGGYQE